jgi:hypothetical protein
MFACHLAFAGVAGLVSTVATAGPRYPDFNGDGKTDLYFLDDYSRLVHHDLADGRHARHGLEELRRRLHVEPAG